MYGTIRFEMRRRSNNLATAEEAKLLRPPGMMLGVDAGKRFAKVTKEDVVELAPGDVVVQFTDGVSEAMNADDEEFGMGRLTDAVARAAAAPAEVIVGSITTSLERFCAGREQDDDVTLLVLRRMP